LTVEGCGLRVLGGGFGVCGGGFGVWGVGSVFRVEASGLSVKSGFSRPLMIAGD